MSGGVPDLEEDRSVVSVEWNRGDIDTLGWSVGFFEFSCSVSLDECGLSDSSVSDHDEFELSDVVDVVLHLDWFVNVRL